MINLTKLGKQSNQFNQAGRSRRGPAGVVAVRAPTSVRRPEWATGEEARCLLLVVGIVISENDRQAALDRRGFPEKVHRGVAGRGGRGDRGPARGRVRPLPHVVRGVRHVVARRR